MMPTTSGVQRPDGLRKDEEALAASPAHPEEPLVIWDAGCHRAKPRAISVGMWKDEME